MSDVQMHTAPRRGHWVNFSPLDPDRVHHPAVLKQFERRAGDRQLWIADKITAGADVFGELAVATGHDKLSDIAGNLPAKFDSWPACQTAILQSCGSR